MSDLDNRRRFARLDLALSVSYSIKGSSETVQNPREALSSDISAGGVRLMTPHSMKPGDLLDLIIELEGNDGDPLQAVGEVVWQNKISNTSYETGVTITEMPTSDRSRFMQFVFDQMSKIIAPLTERN